MAAETTGSISREHLAECKLTERRACNFRATRPETYLRRAKKARRACPGRAGVGRIGSSPAPEHCAAPHDSALTAWMPDAGLGVIPMSPVPGCPDAGQPARSRRRSPCGQADHRHRTSLSLDRHEGATAQGPWL